MNAAGCVFNVNTSYFSQNLFYTLLILFIVLIFIYVKSAKYSFSLSLEMQDPMLWSMDLNLLK